jgi:hypothetical protein
MSSVRVLYANKLVELQVSDDARIAWIRRSKTPSRDADPKEFLEFLTALGRLPVADMAVIVDTREAPGRNDEEFEQKILPQFNAATEKFAKQAMLVRTEVGRIQMQRILKENKKDFPIFTDEEEARRYALGLR